MTYIAAICPSRTDSGAPAVLLQTFTGDVIVDRRTLEAVLALTDRTSWKPDVDKAFEALVTAEAEARAEGWLP